MAPRYMESIDAALTLVPDLVWLEVETGTQSQLASSGAGQAMTELREKIETHIALGLDASPGFFLSMDDLREIAKALKAADELLASNQVNSPAAAQRNT